jgi:hypothetical protein
LCDLRLCDAAVNPDLRLRSSTNAALDSAFKFDRLPVVIVASADLF